MINVAKQVKKNRKDYMLLKSYIGNDIEKVIKKVILHNNKK